MRRTTMTSGSAARIWARAQADKKCKTPECQNNGELIMGMRAALCTECIAMPKPSQLHESEHVALMRRVSHTMQTKHECTQTFADWKVGDMTVDELQNFEKGSN